MAMIADDIPITMPPHPLLYEGRETIGPLLAAAHGPESPGEWRLVSIRAITTFDASLFDAFGLPPTL